MRLNVSDVDVTRSLQIKKKLLRVILSLRLKKLLLSPKMVRRKTTIRRNVSVDLETATESPRVMKLPLPLKASKSKNLHVSPRTISQSLRTSLAEVAINPRRVNSQEKATVALEIAETVEVADQPSMLTLTLLWK